MYTSNSFKQGDWIVLSMVDGLESEGVLLSVDNYGITISRPDRGVVFRPFHVVKQMDFMYRPKFEGAAKSARQAQEIDETLEDATNGSN